MTDESYEMTERLTNFLAAYYREDLGELAQRFPRDQKSLHVDYSDVFRFDPDLAADLREQPHRVRGYFEDALQLYDLPVDVDLSGANVRVFNLPDDEVLEVTEVSRHENIGQLVSVRGQVQKTSKVMPRVDIAVFECKRCGTETIIPQDGDRLDQPHECDGCERQGPFGLTQSSTTWTNHQFARLQQPPERTKGGEGESVDVHLEDDLIEEFNAGDRVVLTGVLEIEEPEDVQYRNFDTRLNAQNVVREESDYEDVDVEAHREEIEAIASGERGDPYDLLVDSINPQHKGDEDVKLAIALQLFGGWSRGQRTRGDSHILLMGDPGCGKSTFLQAVDELAPRSTYASGKGASAPGLTAAAVADDFGDTEWSLEAGALVLADGGVACIDEIDKVNEDAVSSLHDALESQKVRVNKAGINASLNARTALLAAGNPENGRFDQYEARAQQIDLGPTLLSRFDLMFMVSDSPDEEIDREITEHMIRARRAAGKQALGKELTEEERRSVEPAISPEVLRAYIACAKEESTPYIRAGNTDAQTYLREQFLGLRLAYKDEEDHPVPVTFRQEQAIERLAEASARVRLDDEVLKGDVERAFSLVRESLEQVGIDPETGELDADVLETGQSMSQRKRRNQILAIIEDRGHISLDELVEIMNADPDRVKHDVTRLLDEGRVYETEEGLRIP